jgi:hypothetical protein
LSGDTHGAVRCWGNEPVADAGVGGGFEFGPVARREECESEDEEMQI